jgi:glycosyltransferase involved in cell wall biosynthesis
MKVTVAISTYNRPSFLKEAIQSVLDQSYQDIKILIFDDSPSRDTRDVVMSFNSDRIEYRSSKENLGMWRGMNRAFSICDTEYLNIFHDDDRQLPWMIEEEVKILDSKPEVGVVVSSKGHVLSEKIPRKPRKISGKYYPRYELIKALCKNGRTRVVPPSPLFRMSDVKKYDIRFKEDSGLCGDQYMWFWMNQYLNVYSLNYPLLEGRLHEKSTSAMESANENGWFDSYMRIDELLTRLKDEGLDIDLTHLRSYFAEASLYPTMAKFVRGEITFSHLQHKRKEIEEIGWYIGDRRFRYVVAKSVLGVAVEKVGRGEVSVGDFLKELDKVEQSGITVPWERKLGWFIKFVIAKRWLRTLVPGRQL